MLKLKLQYFWPPDATSQLIGKDPDAGKDWRQEEKGTTEDEMVGWHHWLNGHAFEYAPGDGEGQGILACCSSWGCKELDVTELVVITNISQSSWRLGNPRTRGLANPIPQRRLSFWTTDGHLLTASLRGRKRESIGLLFLIQQGYQTLMWPYIATSSRPHYLPNAPFPNTTTLGVTVPTQAFRGATIQYMVDKEEI